MLLCPDDGEAATTSDPKHWVDGVVFLGGQSGGPGLDLFHVHKQFGLGTCNHRAFVLYVLGHPCFRACGGRCMFRLFACLRRRYHEVNRVLVVALLEAECTIHTVVLERQNNLLFHLCIYTSRIPRIFLHGTSPARLPDVT